MTYSQEKPWSEMKEAIGGVVKAKKLADLLDKVFQRATTRKNKLTVLHQIYPWGSEIMTRGIPMGYESGKTTKFREDFQFSSGCPFGIILKNSCEVCDYWTPSRHGGEDQHFYEFVPQTIRSAGDTIGLFELQDLLSEAKHEPSADWAIFAGARSIECLGKLSLGAVRRLKGKYSQSEVGKFEALHQKDPKCVHDHWIFFSKIRNALPERFEPWNVEVAFLSHAWADELVEQIHSNKVHPDLKDLQILLAYDAWRKLSGIVEDASGELRDFFHSRAHGGTDGSIVTEAFRAVETLYQISCGRRPALTPTDKDDELGPFREMAKILKVMNLPPYVLRPALLEPGMHGYMNFSRIALRLQSEKTFVRRFQNVENVWIKVIGEAVLGTKLHRRDAMLRNDIVFRLVTGDDDHKAKTKYTVRRAREFDSGGPVEPFFLDPFDKKMNSKRIFQSAARIDRKAR